MVINDLEGVTHHGDQHVQQHDYRSHMVHDEHPSTNPLGKVMVLIVC